MTHKSVINLFTYQTGSLYSVVGLSSMDVKERLLHEIRRFRLPCVRIYKSFVLCWSIVKLTVDKCCFCNELQGTLLPVSSVFLVVMNET